MNFFYKFSKTVSSVSGHPATFCGAFFVVLVWGITGPFFHFSDSWQLFINTGTTIITFLMVFLIQNSQNRDTLALHLKLDELIRATQGAHNELLDIESLSDEDIRRIHERYENLAHKTQQDLKDGKKDTDAPDFVEHPASAHFPRKN